MSNNNSFVIGEPNRSFNNQADIEGNSRSPRKQNLFRSLSRFPSFFREEKILRTEKNIVEEGIKIREIINLQSPYRKALSNSNISQNSGLNESSFINSEAEEDLVDKDKLKSRRVSKYSQNLLNKDSNQR